MKKFIFMAVAGMLALSSCSNDDNEQTSQNAPRQMTFTAGFGDGATTRATLSGTSVSFDAGDGISILSANNTNTKFTTTAGGASATFTGTATADSKFYALYPYTDGLTLDGDVIKNVVIPSSQDCESTPWDPTAPIAYATTTGSSLTFHNACALLKITNDSGAGTIIEIMLSGEGVYPAGKFDLDTSTGTLTVQDGAPGVRTHVMNNNTTIYLAIAPGQYGMLRAMFESSEGYGSKMKYAHMNPIIFEAGKIYDLGNTSAWVSNY